MPRNRGTTTQGRKILSFYRVNFEYVPPYRVLCDGEMMYQCLKNDLYLKQTLPAILNASAQPVITNCVLEDLRSRGSEYSNATLFAKRTTRLPCTHKAKLNANECLLQKLSNAMDTKIMVAVADVELLTQLRHIPGVPLISILNSTKLVLKPPTKATLDFVRENEKAKTQTISDRDKSLLEQIKAMERATRPERKTIKKKRRAKGPNPLSVKKSNKESKKRTDNPTPNEGHDSGGEKQSLNPSLSLAMTNSSDSVDGAKHGSEAVAMPTSGKRKRGRRRSASYQNNSQKEADSSPPLKESREPMPTSIDGQITSTIEGSHVQNGCTPMTTTRPAVLEISAIKSTEQEPQSKENFRDSVEGDESVFTKSAKQNQTVNGCHIDDDGSQSNTSIPKIQVGAADKAQPPKRKKQRKNRRRRPSKNQ